MGALHRENGGEALKNAEEAITCYLEGLEKLNQIKTAPEAVKGQEVVNCQEV